MVSFISAADDRLKGYDARFFSLLSEIGDDNYWFASRNRLVEWGIRHYAPSAASFFEIGCGSGFVLSALKKTFPDLALSGGELFRQGLLYARRKLPGVTIYQLDAGQLPFSSEFDAIGIFDVLEHLPDDRGALAQIFDALKPGGVLLVTVPQHPFLWSRYDLQSGHARRYTSRSLQKLFAQVGFKADCVTSFVSLLLPLMIVSRIRTHVTRHDHSSGIPEFDIPGSLNRFFTAVMSMERSMIKAGVSFPFGGSLFAVVRKPPARMKSHGK